MNNPPTDPTAAVARIRQMTDAWEQRLPETIRTATVVEAIRAALGPVVSSAGLIAVPPTTTTAEERRERYATAISRWHRDPEQPLYVQGADAVIAVADAEQAELRAEVASLTEASRRLLEQRQEMAEERYAWQERGNRAEARVRTLEEGLPAGSEGTAATRTAVERVRALHQPDANGECQHCHRSSPCPTVQALDDDARRLAAETQPSEPEAAPLHAEDPARVDRLRPEFTDHASVESIDVQTRRAQRQRGLWDSRIRKLAALRATRQAQIEAGTWPSSAAFEADSASQTSPKADSKPEAPRRSRTARLLDAVTHSGPGYDLNPTASAGVQTDEEA